MTACGESWTRKFFSAKFHLDIKYKKKSNVRNIFYGDKAVNVSTRWN